MRRCFLSFALLWGGLAGCQPQGESSSTGAAPPAFGASIQVLDEDGDSVSTASYTLSGADAAAAAGAAGGKADDSGRVRLENLRNPVLVMIEAPGFLPAARVLDRRDAEGEALVRLFREAGPGGRHRVVLHFAGDAMLARRYLEPASDLTPVVEPGDGGESARRVGACVAPLFRIAHISSMNLETVVGEFPAEDAYPAKRFLLQSPPEVVDLLDELGADVVTLGNNHSRDWLDVGVQSTIDALDGAGILHVGAGVSDAQAQATLQVGAAGLEVGFVSCTSVNGDFVNDRLPDDTSPVPGDVSPADAWQYEFRTFGYTGPGVDIPVAPRRIGGFWRVFESVEDGGLAPEVLADVWASAAAVYPELQDWVERRGHGGANAYFTDRMVRQIGELRAAGCDIVVVQIHGGYQFFEVKSKLLESAAHRAVDAGADLVICHHPHVLQGFEWYGGKLIAYSLGNFVFDQDFLTTFPSVVLQTVFEEGTLLEARVYPVVLDRYRPVPLGGAAALQVVQSIQERSVLPLRSERIDGAVRNVLRAPPAGAVTARFVSDGSSARIETGPLALRTVTATLEEGAILDLDPPYLTGSRREDGSSLGPLLLGRDLFRAGSFEDHGADGESRGGTHWIAGKSYKRIAVVSSAPSGVRCLRLRRTEKNSSRVLARPVARIPLVKHRMYRETGGTAVPEDGEASYSLRLQALLYGEGVPLARWGVYHFDDTDPTREPESILLRTRETALDIPADGAWHEIVFDIPAEFLQPGSTGLEANAVLLYVGLDPPLEGESVLWVDDLQFLEWRAADETPEGLYALDAVRLEAGAGPFAVELVRTAD